MTSVRLAVLTLIVGSVLPAAARASVHGGIEIGAKGVKATAIEMTGDATNPEIRVLMADTDNTSLTAGIDRSGRFAPDALTATGAAAAKFAARLRDEFKVPTEHTYVVGSSGLFAATANDPAVSDANRAALAESVRSACGLTMTFVDARREAELSVVGTIPAKFRDVAVLVDVGSGNTKGGYRADAKIVTFGVPFGSVTLAETARKRQDAADEYGKLLITRKELLNPRLKKAAEEHPELTTRRRVYLSGGAVWAMASFARPGDRSPYLTLTPEDLAAYQTRLRAAPGKYPTVDLTGLSDHDRAGAEKEIERVKKAFKPDQLLAGSEILAGLWQEFGFEKREVAFARHATVAWLLAYVAEASRPVP